MQNSYHDGTSRVTDPSHRRAPQAELYPNDRRSEPNNSRNYGGHDLNYQHYDLNAHQEHSHSHYQEVPRSWESGNPELNRVINNPNLMDAIARLERRNIHTPHRSSARQSQPTPNEHHYPQHQPFDHHSNNNRPLGMSNLQDLNERRPRTYPIDGRINEHQHAGPYDAVGYVSRQSDHERNNEPQGYEEYEGYEEVDFDDRSSATFF